jgi:hypothetical protein
MKKICIIILTFTCLACTNSNETAELKYSPFIGEYKILSLESNIALDLNRNGVASNDFLNEISTYFNLYSLYNVPTLTIIKGADNQTNGFYDHIPKQDVNQTDVNDIQYFNSGPLKVITFNNNFSEVTDISGYYDDSYYQQKKWAILKNITILNTNELLATFEQQYFTIETGWKTCILTAKFTKIN